MPWDFDKATPVYMQIANELRGRIVRGTYAISSQLPSVRDLAIEASVNPNTVQRAYASLEDEGLIVTKGTLGRFVTDDAESIGSARREIALGLAAGYCGNMRTLGYSTDEICTLTKEALDTSAGIDGEGSWRTEATAGMSDGQ